MSTRRVCPAPLRSRIANVCTHPPPTDMGFRVGSQMHTRSSPQRRRGTAVGTKSGHSAVELGCPLRVESCPLALGRRRAGIGQKEALGGRCPVPAIFSSAVVSVAQVSSGTTTPIPNCRKCSSKAKAVVMPKRSMMTRLVQSVKLQPLSENRRRVTQCRSASDFSRSAAQGVRRPPVARVRARL